MDNLNVQVHHVFSDGSVFTGTYQEFMELVDGKEAEGYISVDSNELLDSLEPWQVWLLTKAVDSLPSHVAQTIIDKYEHDSETNRITMRAAFVKLTNDD